jgi:hypothetical protein
MKEIPKKDVAKFTAIPAVGGASRVITPAETSQRSWESPALAYLLLIETSPEYTLITDDNGFGILIA